MTLLPFTLLAFLSLGVSALADDPREADLCIYGGTSGAVISAVQAKRMNKSVILVSPDQHLGGVTSGGLGWTDIGNNRILGGVSREFFEKAYAHYNDDKAWDLQPRNSYRNAAQHGPAMDHANHTMSVFEPKVAEAIFDGWVKEYQIPVLKERLDRSAKGLVMDGKRIVSLRTESGRTIKAKMFIDATYEGDLMALAGVSYTTGREPNSKYGETISGIQAAKASGNQLPKGIDPYVKAGDKSSGLLPGVNPVAGGKDGEADKKLQAYCYRMCLTNHAPNRVMIEKPEGYRESDYELLFRAVEAGQTDRFFKTGMMPNYKTDSNNDSGISTDYIGYNYAYPEADYATRASIAKAHENWQRGLVWTLQNHPRIPEPVRKKWSGWGLPKDEFKDTGNWPHALYVREARRMVSDHVVTQSLIDDSSPVRRSVAMGAYSMDSHNVQRYVSGDGTVRNEGDIQMKVAKPYRIDYGAIVPKKSECTNLFVTFCLSSSHMAFGSIRMEAVFMTLSQSASTAAAIAIDDGTAVQDVPYEKLSKRLLDDSQVLTLD